MSPSTPPPATTNGASTLYFPTPNCVTKYAAIPMTTEASGNGEMERTLNAIENTAATTSPTAEALSPGSALRYTGSCLNLPQKGSTPKMSMTPGPKSPSQHDAIPTRTFMPARVAMTAPRYALRLNSGPGMACTMPRPVKNCSSVTQLSALRTSWHTVSPSRVAHTSSYCTTSSSSSGSTTCPPPKMMDPVRKKASNQCSGLAASSS
mmetsp:Transcript_23035/g.78479  ORF Transcript_23035/g.78479 Transcript_23035/m.78479 type:complete len:207 (+) Transcript_23035:130-750(+)